MGLILHLISVCVIIVAYEIIRESQSCDLLVIGITNRSFMYRAVRTSIPETIAQSIDKPLVMVKSSGIVGSVVRRLV